MQHITIVIPDCRINLTTVSGTLEILSQAHEYWQKRGNRPTLNIQVAGFVETPKPSDDYLTIHPTDIRKIKQTNLVIIPSLLREYERAIGQNDELLNWIKKQYKNGAEIASICSGGFLLAATGLLEGKTCSMHWNAAETFRQLFPNVKIAEDKIITDQNGIYTNGGAYSFLNLLVYLVEKLFDRETAIYCSKVFQIDIERTTQSPFAIFHIQKGHGDELISQAQKYIEENLDAKISFEKLASHLAISRRNFDRRFIKATGNTPVEYLQRVKVEAAKKELEKGRKTIFEIMNEVGYSDDKAFREVFKKVTGISPADYMNKYKKENLALPA